MLKVSLFYNYFFLLSFIFEDNKMSEMNKNTASIFMIMFFVSCVVCRQIQIFDEIKEYNLQVVGIVSC